MKLVNVMRTVRAAVGVLAAAVLVSCGGGDRVEEFAPKRLIAFGDENSVIDDSADPGNGRKYTVNGLVVDDDGDYTGELDCITNPIWIQYLSAQFGIVFESCNPTNAADPQGRIFAEPGARVADVVAQIDAYLAADSLSGTDLITVMVGQHDVLAHYALYDGSNYDDVRALSAAAGEALGKQVTRLAEAGGKVLISTVPDVAYSPYMRREDLAHPLEERPRVMKDLVFAFNEALRANFPNNGEMIGLVQADEQVQILADEDKTSLDNWTTPVCDPSKAPTVDQCTQATLITGGSSSEFLWADSTHLTPAGHRSIGSLAVTRATNNPF
jgi:outer membrane lipase/esterase